MSIVDLADMPNASDDYVGFLEDVCQKYELDYASYAAINLPAREVQGYATYPDEWKQHYIQRGYYLIDPTLHVAARSIAPVDWTRFERDEKFDRVFNDARAFGVPSTGVTIPVRGPYGDCALLSVTRDCPEDEWKVLRRRMIGDLQMLAVHMHDSVMQSGVVNRALYAPQLSQREREVLQWIAAGKSQADIAQILGISNRTVEVHLRSARDKMGALTTPQAVGRAVSSGIIQPN